MALASISDSPASPSLGTTEQVYAAQAKELSLLGVNWTYAPVGDVNSDRRNPVIGVRSFGDGQYSVFNSTYRRVICVHNTQIQRKLQATYLPRAKDWSPKEWRQASSISPDTVTRTSILT